MPSVLVVDDQDLIRSGLAALLRAAPGIDTVTEAADGAQAAAAAARTRPDVILMDIRMPVLDGIAATTQILASATDPPPRIIILTTFDLDEYVHAALRAGACGFLLKDTPPARILAAVDAVASGDLPFAPAITRRLIAAYADRPDPVAGPPAVLAALTPREVDVLRQVAGGLTNADIAERLYVTEATVKTHFNRILTKLRLASRAQAVVLAYECGLVTPRDR